MFFHCIRNISESLSLKNYCVNSFFSTIIQFFLGMDWESTSPSPRSRIWKFLRLPHPQDRVENPPFCSFISFLIVLVTPFNKILESSRAWTIFIMSFISSFEITKIVVPETCIFFRISASIAEAAAVIYSIMILKTDQIELF